MTRPVTEVPSVTNSFRHGPAVTASRVARSLAACLLLAVACGDGKGSSPDAGLTSLNPPANIDAVSCYDVAASDISACSACCTENNFRGSVSYDGHCVCGERRDDSGDSVCAAQASSAGVCMQCCSTAGFTGHGWSGGSDIAGTCGCMGRNNAEVCKSTLLAPMPSRACQICCLNNGYLSYGYDGIDPGECRCFEL